MARDSKVVDFQRFRASQQRDAKRLPLFDGLEPLQPPPAARDLTDREVTHRERMLTHLKTSAIGDR
jgi:hypothetical protein